MKKHLFLLTIFSIINFCTAMELHRTFRPIHKTTRRLTAKENQEKNEVLALLDTVIKVHLKLLIGQQNQLSDENVKQELETFSNLYEKSSTESLFTFKVLTESIQLQIMEPYLATNQTQEESIKILKNYTLRLNQAKNKLRRTLSTQQL